MPNFVDDLTSLAYPKVQTRATVPGREDNTLQDVDWNDLCQAAVDMRAKIISLISGATEPRGLIQRQVLTATSGTWTPAAGTKKVRFRMVAGGGGGGAAAGGANIAFAGGGASGWYIEGFVDGGDDDITGGAFACGAGGSAGSAGGAGGLGGDTTIVINGVTWTCKGGTGGGAMATGSTVLNTTEAQPVSAGSSVGDVAFGSAGMRGVRLSSTTGWAGKGGECPFGGSRSSISTAADCSAAYGYGSGGGGGAAAATGRSGAAGMPGLIITEEFA